MKLKTAYNFKEAELGPNFAPQHMKTFRELIDASLSFVVMSMPGVGASYFLKYLAMQSFAYFIHVDLYELPSLTQHEFYKLLLYRLGEKAQNKTDDELLLRCKSILFPLTQEFEKLVIIFSRFDQLKKEFDWNLLSNIQSLSSLAPGKIVLIFTSTKPLVEVTPDAVSGGNMNFYSENLYFKPYSKDDLKKLLKIEPARPTSKETLDNLLELSGGHNQLFHILLSSQKQQNLLLDQFVRLQMKELVEYLDYQQKKQIQKIALDKMIDEVDEYLLGVGMVTRRVILSDPERAKRVEGESKDLHKYQLFSPLLKEYLKSYYSPKLPPKESRLFKLLRNNIGKVVSKDEIFNMLWEDNPDAGSDWALDALIYRLRKHPFMKSSGYTIESHKKLGYSLIQH